jgi:hypothetical protein
MGEMNREEWFKPKWRLMHRLLYLWLVSLAALVAVFFGGLPP